MGGTLRDGSSAPGSFPARGRGTSFSVPVTGRHDSPGGTPKVEKRMGRRMKNSPTWIPPGTVHRLNLASGVTGDRQKLVHRRGSASTKNHSQAVQDDFELLWEKARDPFRWSITAAEGAAGQVFGPHKRVPLRRIQGFPPISFYVSVFVSGHSPLRDALPGLEPSRNDASNGAESAWIERSGRFTSHRRLPWVAVYGVRLSVQAHVCLHLW